MYVLFVEGIGSRCHYPTEHIYQGTGNIDYYLQPLIR